MKKFKFKFTANLIGAIGKPQKFTQIIEAPNLHDATLKLYDTYEHIQNLIQL